MWTLALLLLVAWLILRKPTGVFLVEIPPRPIPRSQLRPDDLRHTLSR